MRLEAWVEQTTLPTLRWRKRSTTPCPCANSVEQVELLNALVEVFVVENL